MNAMQAIQRDAYEIEAEGYCRDHIPGATHEDVLKLAASLRHRAYLEAIQPLVQAKTRLYACKMPKIIVDQETGHISTEYEFSEVEQKALDDFDRMIGEMAQWFRASDRVERSQATTGSIADNTSEGVK